MTDERFTYIYIYIKIDERERERERERETIYRLRACDYVSEREKSTKKIFRWRVWKTMNKQ